MAHDGDDPADTLADALARTLDLLQTSATQELADELAALSSIYESADGQPSLSLFTRSPTSRSSSPARAWVPSSTRPLRLVLSTTLSESHEHPLHILISIPSTYPHSESPLLQLHDRYIGPELVSDDLFGVILRTYMHEEALGDGVQWRKGEVCLYEGIEWVRDRCAAWVAEKEEERRKKEVVRAGVGVYRIGLPEEPRTHSFEREEEVDEAPKDATYYADEALARKIAREEAANARASPVQGAVCPEIFSSEPILDRKSVGPSAEPEGDAPADLYAGVCRTQRTRKVARRGDFLSPPKKSNAPNTHVL